MLKKTLLLLFGFISNTNSSNLIPGQEVLNCDLAPWQSSRQSLVNRIAFVIYNYKENSIEVAELIKRLDFADFKLPIDPKALKLPNQAAIDRFGQKTLIDLALELNDYRIFDRMKALGMRQ